ncbi:coiled-coil domain-containing protein 22 homolog [Topomyia yanbarensis]|uniref:coiled-coil domain-containing protein 22 homolog n=1 Tax=Topomyia yanbarensis TaxID=2498891 RepID=UPI00273CAC09|nr:coiled-coil domain-containing protein 22 homolog [Topomyia yanbarensis]XP_058831112.1 coiled-coil domain-containing protein 22 homolog [Topomyia yanbarensis]
MDEIDNIIFHSLRQIGCNLDEEVSSFDEISPSQLVPIVSKCIALIDPSLDLPKSLPPGMAQRFTTTASLAEACRTIGYRREIGYQTFLYSNVTEVRRVMMFLIERLPKDSSDKTGGSGQPVDCTTELETQITASLQSQLQAPWMPEFCRFGALESLPSTSTNASQARVAFRQFVPKKINIPFVTHSDVVDELKQFWSLHKLESLDDDNMIPTVIAANDGAIKSNVSGGTDEVDRHVEMSTASEKLLEYYGSTNKSTQRKSPQKISSASPSNTTGPTQLVASATASSKTGISPLESLHTEMDQIQVEIERIVAQCDELEVSRQQLNDTIEEHRRALATLRDEKKFKERTHILLEDPEVNVRKLEGIIAAGGERMRKLQDQWNAHRTPLLETLDAYRARDSNKQSKVQPLLDQIEATRLKCEQVVTDLQTKSAMHLRLQQEFEKLNKTVSRTAYTSRILEIVGNIRKQKTGIDMILQDTRTLQKDLNTITGQLDRQFTVTDDLIFRNAKKDEHSKRAYKLLVTLHSDCAELIGLVQETGSIKREIRDLEDQIENEKGRNTAANLAQITNDLTEMQNESHRLEESIRRLEEASREQVQ